MNKQALVEMVQGKLGGTKVQAEEVVDAIFDGIVATMKKKVVKFQLLDWYLFCKGSYDTYGSQSKDR